MTGGRITKTYDVATPWFQTEHGVETCDAVYITVRDIQVICAGYYILLVEIMLRVIVLEIVEDVKDVVKTGFEFF